MPTKEKEKKGGMLVLSFRFRTLDVALFQGRAVHCVLPSARDAIYLSAAVISCSHKLQCLTKHFH
jgi:hypothetical protein